MRLGWRNALTGALQTSFEWSVAGCISLALGLAAGCSRPAPEPAATAPGRVRVASLAPSLTEIVCALGAGGCLVGRSSVCDYPPAVVTNVPVVGGFGAPSLEMLARCRPDVVLSVALEDAATVQAMERLGLRHVRIKSVTIDDIPEAILAVGRIVHREEAAQRMAGGMRAELATLRARPRPEPAPAVFVEIWGDPLITAGKRSFLSELIALAGGRNIADDVGRDYFQMSSEAVLARDPDVIVMLDQKSADAAARTIASRGGWAQLKAVRAGRVYSGLDESVLEQPGPRVLEGVRILKRCIGGKAAGSD